MKTNFEIQKEELYKKAEEIIDTYALAKANH